MTNVNRWYCFTINNYTATDIEQLTAFCGDVDYLTYGFEKGTEENTPHVQGYVELAKPQRFSWIKKRLPRAHLEPRKGSRTQARDYCHKEDTKPFEYGKWKPDKQGMRNDLISVRNKIDEGATTLEIATDHFGTWCRNHRAFARYRLLKRKRVCTEKTVIWIYGKSGTGKTRTAHEKYPDAFWKDPGHKWFDGYDGEDVVILDDFRPTWWSWSYMLRLLDRYPLKVECKGTTVAFTPHTIVITAPCDPATMYSHMDEEIRQLTRRITEIKKLEVEG